MVKDKLESRWPGLQVDLLKMVTQGDQIADKPLRTVGGKGLFVKEIEEALLQKKADIAVHSMKDVPFLLPDSLKIGVILEREDPADVLLTNTGAALSELSPRSVVGTSSLRRQLQILGCRSDLEVKILRGNVDTRLRKLRQGEYDAIILALAGLRRLGLHHQLKFETLPFVCAPGQGAIGIEYRAEQTELDHILKFLHHEPTSVCIRAERMILKNLEGGCELPLGAQATIQQDKILLKAFLANPTGSILLEDELEGEGTEPEMLGEKLSQKLFQKGAEKILEEIRSRFERM